MRYKLKHGENFQAKHKAKGNNSPILLQKGRVFQAWWACAYNTSAPVAEVRILLQFLGQYGLHSEFHVRAHYRLGC